MDPQDIDTLLPPELVSLEEPPAEKNACIEYLLDMAVEAGRVEDREAALEALLAREEETTTGVGLGIGIPHAQTDAVTRPTVVFARSERGVDFDAMDDEPATLIFMLLVPEGGSEEHLGMLSSLSRALMHEDVRDSLHEAESPEAVRETLKEAVA
ncbi:PTS sugar transporter subunit IIA [Halalkalicoccus salilacus]|uniref:PTS sugar transporter subunit IIA n=1 Tax=Halalkalicoccus salilacus TaxID=3117459 RepID=UPI00300F4893